MPNPWTEVREQWARISESCRTQRCTRGVHADCPHRSGMGGGFSLLRLPPEIGAFVPGALSWYGYCCKGR